MSSDEQDERDDFDELDEFEREAIRLLLDCADPSPKPPPNPNSRYINELFAGEKGKWGGSLAMAVLDQLGICSPSRRTTRSQKRLDGRWPQR